MPPSKKAAPAEPRRLVRRQCPVCGWEDERVETAAADAACPQCRAPTNEQQSTELGPPGAEARAMYAAALGRLGGLKGGKARARALTKKRRSEIARKAAQARWGKK